MNSIVIWILLALRATLVVAGASSFSTFGKRDSSQTGCLPDTGNINPGFQVKFYNFTNVYYPGADPVFVGSNSLYFPQQFPYFAYEYKEAPNVQIGEVNGVTDIDWVYNVPECQVKCVKNGEIYGFETTVTNFTAEYTGYFKPNISGEWNFKIHGDNAALVWFGDGEAFSCCDPGTYTPPAGNTTLFASSFFGGASEQHPETTQYLDGSLYYPIRIVLSNGDGPGALTLIVTDPNGNVLNDLGNYVSYEVNVSEYCPAPPSVTYTTPWTGTTTRTTTHPEY